MPRVLIANKTYYFTSDYTRVVERGHPDAAFLCAREGTAVDPDVAERFSLDVRDGTATSVVAQSTPSAEGVSPEVAVGYHKMAATRAVNENMRAAQEGARRGHTSRQKRAAIHGAINEELGLTSDRPDEPGRLRTADMSGGQTGKPISGEVDNDPEAVRERVERAVEPLSGARTAPRASDVRGDGSRAPEAARAQDRPHREAAGSRTVDVGGGREVERPRAELEADNAAAETRGEEPPHDLPPVGGAVDAERAAEETRERGGTGRSGEHPGAPLAGVPSVVAPTTESSAGSDAAADTGGAAADTGTPLLTSGTGVGSQPGGGGGGSSPKAGDGEGDTLREALADSPSVGRAAEPGEVREASPRAPTEQTVHPQGKQD